MFSSNDVKIRHLDPHLGGGFVSFYRETFRKRMNLTTGICLRTTIFPKDPFVCPKNPEFPLQAAYDRLGWDSDHQSYEFSGGNLDSKGFFK